MPLLFIAMPDPAAADMNGEGLPYAQAESDAAAAGFSVAKGWATLDQLFQMLSDALRAARDCMAVLEIYAHGNPEICDGIYGGDWARYFGQKLYGIPLCDRVDIFLSGCNTAVRTATAESVAQQVSRHTPTRAADNKLVLVHGSVGYLSGTNMQGRPTSTERATVKKHKYEPYPAVPDATGTLQPGSTAATGGNCFRTFIEGIG